MLIKTICILLSWAVIPVAGALWYKYKHEIRSWF